MSEVWKDVEGFEGYQISNHGNFQSCRFGTKIGLVFKYWRPIKTSLSGNKCNVLIDLVDKQGFRKSYIVSRLMYEHFVGRIPKGMLVDHIDRNGQNNVLSNLRLATSSQNNTNQKVRKGKQFKYKGARKTRDGKWEARSCYKGKAVYLGRFDSELEAARRYDTYAKETYGEFAVTNF